MGVVFNPHRSQFGIFNLCNFLECYKWISIGECQCCKAMMNKMYHTAENVDRYVLKPPDLHIVASIDNNIPNITLFI